MNWRQTWIALETIVIREVTRILRIWVQTLLPPAITMALYFLIFGGLIGSRVGQIQQVSYLTFITPGLVLMAVINNAYANVSSSFFSSRFQKNVEELLVSPTPAWVILTGYCLGGVLRGLLVGLVVLGIAFLFEPVHIEQPGLALLSAVVAAALASMAGFLNACYARKFDDISIIPTFVLTPLTYLGGVFFALEMLPPAWQVIARLNPLLYLVSVFRFGFTGLSEVSVGAALIAAMVCCVALALLNIRLLRVGKGLRQ